VIVGGEKITLQSPEKRPMNVQTLKTGVVVGRGKGIRSGILGIERKPLQQGGTRGESFFGGVWGKGSMATGRNGTNVVALWLSAWGRLFIQKKKKGDLIPYSLKKRGRVFERGAP